MRQLIHPRSWSRKNPGVWREILEAKLGKRIAASGPASVGTKKVVSWYEQFE